MSRPPYSGQFEPSRASLSVCSAGLTTWSLSIFQKKPYPPHPLYSIPHLFGFSRVCHPRHFENVLQTPKSFDFHLCFLKRHCTIIMFGYDGKRISVWSGHDKKALCMNGGVMTYIRRPRFGPRLIFPSARLRACHACVWYYDTLGWRVGAGYCHPGQI